MSVFCNMEPANVQKSKILKYSKPVTVERLEYLELSKKQKCCYSQRSESCERRPRRA